MTVKILVTGNPRSGTLSTKNMLRAAGYDVLHEKMGPEGTVSNFYQFQPKRGYWPKDCKHQGETFDLSRFTHRIHLVRNPLKCIPSMARIVSRGWREWLGDNGVVDPDIKPKMLWSAHAWCALNKLAEKNTTHRMRIEHVLIDWPEDLRKPPQALWQHKASGNRKSDWMTLDELYWLGDVSLEVLRLAAKYGYKQTEEGLTA